MRRKLAQHVQRLKKVKEPNERVRKAIRTLDMCVQEMKRACGPHMLIPFK